MSHTITITRLPDEQHDDAEYEIGGTCDEWCTVWDECAESHPAAAWTTYDTAVFHGVEHRDILGVGWCVRTTQCGLDYTHELGLEAEQAEAGGTYALDIEWDGDGWIAYLGDPEPHSSEPGAIN